MKKQLIYHKHTEKYLRLTEMFSNYITSYKLDKLSHLPQSSTIVIFDDTDKTLSDYSNYVLKRLLKAKTKNIYEVRKTGSKNMPWKISTPVNFV